MPHETIPRHTPPPSGGTGITRGFTLIELLISLAIIAILASGAVSMFEVAAVRSREAELRTALRDIRSALDAYKVAADSGRIAKAADASGYPPNLSILEQGVVDAHSPARKKIYFLRRVPRDPFAPSDVTALDSWGLRSYSSDPDSPEPGRDVFDVYSRSTKPGLNGIPYNKW